MCPCQVVTLSRLQHIAHVVVNLCCVAYAFHRTYFTYELASSNTHSCTPTAEELKYLIDHLRKQAQLNENYAREERCLDAVLEATRAYHDLTSPPFPPANISPLRLFTPYPSVRLTHAGTSTRHVSKHISQLRPILPSYPPVPTTLFISISATHARLCTPPHVEHPNPNSSERIGPGYVKDPPPHHVTLTIPPTYLFILTASLVFEIVEERGGGRRGRR